MSFKRGGMLCFGFGRNLARFNMSYKLIRNLLFKLDPETSHKVALKGLNFLYKIHFLRPHTLNAPRTVMGIKFPNPVGLAAGLDKDGDYIDALAALGFGFIELGTVTPYAQKGNPTPRLFRIPKAEAIINRLGFNNCGVQYLVQNIKEAKFKGIIGINIGKNFDTPIENALDDYLKCLHHAYPHASYITVNISSPNTPGLRSLQFGEHLEHLLHSLKTEQKKLALEYHKYVPLAVKISPDLTQDEIAEIAKALLQHKIDGVIATNTTADHSAVADFPYGNEQGGLSGKPLFPQATEVIKQLHAILQDKIPIIAVGGIMSAEDAKAKFDAGASLVQIYTGFIYEGPRLINEIVNLCVSEPT